MNLKYLTTFKKILETGSFQKAAQQLNYTQSTITFQIQQLEQELEVNLFEKIGRKMIPTQAGKNLIPQINIILNTLEQMHSGNTSDSKITGTLKIALPESLLTYQMQPILKDFHEIAPEVKLSLQALNCYEIYNKILSGAVDIGLHFDLKKNNSNIISHPLANYKMILLSSPHLKIEDQNFLDHNQKKDLIHICNGPISIFQQLFTHYLNEKNIKLQETWELWSIEAIKQSISSNLGIAYLPLFTVENELKDQTLKSLPLDKHHDIITAMYSYHKNKWLNPAIKLFLDLVKKHFPN